MELKSNVHHITVTAKFDTPVTHEEAKKYVAELIEKANVERAGTENEQSK